MKKNLFLITLPILNISIFNLFKKINYILTIPSYLFKNYVKIKIKF